MTEMEPRDRMAAVPEAARDGFLDLLLEHWPRIATVAWDGWRVQGRGTVTVEHGSIPPVLAYRPGAPCPCCAGRVEAYDPERQAVVAVVQDDGAVVWIETLGGEPQPVHADALPAAVSGATLH
jgi:hypothetical protein